MSDKNNTLGCGCGNTKKPTPKPEPQVCSKCSGVSGITYFKLKFDKDNPRYNGDCTKNCGLYGEEIDKNFFFLRNAYIYTAYTEQSGDTKELVLERVNGDKIYADIVGDREFDHDFMVSGHSIYVKYPKTDEWVPFLDAETGLPAKFLLEGDDVKVATDATIDGNGTCERPLSIDLAYRTGAYAPADFFIDLTCPNTSLKQVPEIKPGHAVITKELVSRFGCLYNYPEVAKINAELGADTHACGWRVPTHEDWAKLLNSLECPEDRNHESVITGPHGRIAGHELKSKDFWKESNHVSDPEDGDVLGLSVYPAGSCLDETESKERVRELYNGFGDRADYWSSTLTDNGDYLTRKFIYSKNEVHVDTEGLTCMLSLRLVRDVDEGEVDHDYEYILDNYVPVVKTTSGTQLWTKVNIGFTHYEGYDPDGVFVPDEWRNVEMPEGEGEFDAVSEFKFFYNAWDGERWHRKQMTEGESVVLLKEDENVCGTGVTVYVTEENKNHEWRIFVNPETNEDELIDIFAEINETIDQILKDLEDHEEVAAAAFNDLNDRLNDANARFNEFKEKLEKELTDHEEIAAAAFNDLNDRLLEAKSRIEALEAKKIVGDDSIDVRDKGNGVTEIGIKFDPDDTQIRTGEHGIYFDGDFGTSTGEPEDD